MSWFGAIKKQMILGRNDENSLNKKDFSVRKLESGVSNNCKLPNKPRKKQIRLVV